MAAKTLCEAYSVRGRICIRSGISIFLLTIFSQAAMSQQILHTLEPGIGFFRFKQWAIERQLVFESFTKDSMVVRDTGIRHWESIRIQVRFCGGDDYDGKAYNLIIQQLFDQPKFFDALMLQRDYTEFLSGSVNPDGQMPGSFAVRRDRRDGSGEGLAVKQEAKSEVWEVGLFKKDKFAMVQTIRRRDSLCQ